MKKLEKYLNDFESSFLLYPITYLAVIGFLLYFRSLFNGFVQDDGHQIVINSLVHNLLSPFGAEVGYYRPLLSIIDSIELSIFGYQPSFFHLIDLFLHNFNGILLFILFKQIFTLQKVKYAQTISFFLALVFIIHPIQVESVAYISDLPELLVGFFILSSLIFVNSYCQGKDSIKRFLLICFLIFASLLSKETGIILIVLIPLFCYLLYGIINRFTFLMGIIPFLAYGILRFAIAKIPLPSTAATATSPIQTVDLPTRLMTIPYEIASYVRLIVFPKDLYTSQKDLIYQISDPKFLSAVLVSLLVVMTVTFVMYKYKTKVLLFFFLWIILSFAMISNIFPLDFTIAERWLYTPMIAILGFWGLIIARLVSVNKNVRLIVLLITIIAIPLMLVRTYIRIANWQSNIILTSHDILYEKQSASLYYDYAISLYALGDLKKSVHYLNKTIELDPNDLGAQINHAVFLAKDGESSKSRKLFYDMLQANANKDKYDLIAQAFYFNEKDPDLIIAVLNKPLSITPESAVLNQLMAISYLKKEATKSAFLYAEKAYKLDSSEENLQILNKTR